MESVRFEFTKKIDSIPKADKYDSAIDAVRAKKQEQQNEEIRFNFTKKIDTVPNNISPFDRITQMGKEYFKNQQQSEDLLTRIPSVNYNEDYAKVKNISDSDIVDYFLGTQYQSEKKRLEDEKAAIESGLRQFASENVTQIAENAGIPGARFESDRINRNNAETMREVNRINGELEALNKIITAKAAGKSNKELLTLYNNYISLSDRNDLKEQAEKEIEKQRASSQKTSNPLALQKQKEADFIERLNPVRNVKQAVINQNTRKQISENAANAASVIPFFEDYEENSQGPEISLPFSSVMSDEEKGIFNYIKNTSGDEAAKRYYNDLSKTYLEDRFFEKQSEEAFDYAKSHPVLSSVGSVFTNLYGAAEQGSNMLMYLFSGGEYEIPKSWGAEMSGQLRAGVSDKFNWKIKDWDAFDFVYNTAMSGIDSATAFALSGGVPGVGAGLLGLSAAASTTNDIIERGGTNEQAFLGGLAAGTFETLFEKISLGNLKALKEIPAGNFKDTLKNMAKSMLVNASEESLTEIANIAYDTFVNADISQYKHMLEEYMKSGLTEAEARKKAAQSFALQVLEAGAGGALMGVGFAGISSVRTARSSSKAKRSEGSYIKRTAAASQADVKDIAEYYKSAAGNKDTEEAKALKKSADKVLDGDTSDFAVGEMLYNAQNYSESVRKNGVYKVVGSAVKTQSNGITGALRMYEELSGGGAELSEEAQQLYSQINAVREEVSDISLGKFMLELYAANPQALPTADTVKTAEDITAQQTVDSAGDEGYNDFRGDINDLYNKGRTAQTERGVEEAGYEIAGEKEENGRAWGESEEAFTARTQKNANKAGRGKRILLKHSSGSLAYTEKSADNTQASRAAKMLNSAGVEAVYCDGDIETNQNGVTTRHDEAITAPDGTVYVSSEATLPSAHIASHEIVHSAERIGAQAYTDYQSVICDNLLFGSKAYESFCGWINENHYGGKYDIEDISSAGNFIREIAAYVNEFLVTDTQLADKIFSGMFEDWDAVKAASQKFNRDIGADFTGSAFSSDENGAGLPDGVRSEVVTLDTSGKKRRHLNRAEQVYIKKTANAFGVNVIFENVKETTGIAGDSYYDGNGNIHMDFSVADPLNILIKHELTHFGEDSKEYTDFVQLVKDSKAFEKWINSKITGNKSVGAKSAQYRKEIMDRYERAGKTLTVTGADGEMTANFVADTLFTDNGSGMDALIKQAAVKDRNVLIQWVIDFIRSVKSLFKGQYIPPEVLRLERKYVQMLKDAQGTERQKNTADGGEKFSIAQDNDGNNVVIIDTDQGLFAGVDKSEYRKIAKEYLNEHFKNTVLPLSDYDLVYVGKEGIGKYTYSGKKIESNANDAKMKAATELDNLLETSEYIRSSGDRKNHNFAEYGFDYYRTRFIVDGQVFEGIIDIGVSENGAEFYGMTHIENVTSRYYDKYSDLLSGYKFVTQDDIYNYTVPQNSTESQDYYTQGNGNNSDKKQFSIPEDQASLLDQYDNGEISRQEYLEKSNENWQKAVEEYGTIPEGEKAVEKIPVPKSVDGKEKTRRFSRTVIETGALTDRMVEEMGTALLLGDFSYKVSSDKAAQEHADKAVKNGTAEQEWQKTVLNAQNISKDNIAVGEKLLIKAINSKDTKRVLEISAELAEIMTKAGQELQAATLLKKMTGAGRLVSIQRHINATNSELETRYGDAAPTIKLDPLIAEQLADTQPGENIESICKDVLQDVAAQVPATWLDKVNQWRYFAMLCGPRTHIRNLAGNTVFSLEVFLKNIYAVELEHIFIRDVSRRTKAVLLKKEYKDFAKSLLRRGDIREMLSGNGQLDDKGKINQMRRIFKTEWLENVTKGNSNLLEAEDMLFKNLHFKMAVAGFLQARKVNLKSISNDMLAEAVSYGIKEAKKATFQDASEMANYLNSIKVPKKGETSSLKRAVKIAEKTTIEAVLPFKRTPINIVKRGIEYSPLGLIKAGFEINDYFKGRITISELLDTFSAVASGSTFMLIGMFLHSIGAVQGGFGDDDEDKFKKLNGEQEYSINVLGHTYTIDWAAPASIPFFVGVELMEEIAEGDNIQFRDITESFWNTLEPITNLSMLQGIQNLIQSVKYEDSSRTFGTIMGDAATSYITQFIPALSGGVARTIDSTQRTWYTDKNSPLDDFTQSAFQNIISKIPGATYFQTPSIDEWGREKSRGGLAERVLENFISPGYFSSEQYTALDREIQRLAESTGENSVYPNYAAKSFEVNGETKYLTADEYQKYATAKGQYSLQYISDFMSNAAYNRLTDSERAKVIENLYKYANAKAKTEVSDYDITKSFKRVYNLEKSGTSPVIYYISLAIQ